jgi:protein subunit release factor B
MLLDSLRDQITAYKDQVEYLQTELTRRSEEHREEMRRKDHLLAAALERIPAIEAPLDTPSEPREQPETASETESKEEPPAEERRPWWQRMFGG